MDSISGLADDYQQFRYRQNPMWAHMSGEYSVAGSYTDVSAAGEEAAVAEAREFAARAEAISDDDLDEQERLSRAMLVWDASSTAELGALRSAEYGANPIFGAQASLGMYLPKLSIPTPEVADAMVDKLRAWRRTSPILRTGTATVSPPAAPRPRSLLRTRSRSSTSGSPRRWGRTGCSGSPPTPDGVDRDALVANLEQVVDDDVRPALATYLAVLRDDVMPVGARRTSRSACCTCPAARRPTRR